MIGYLLNAAFADGAAADRKDPNDTEVFETKIIIPQQIKNLPTSLLRFDIQ